MRNPSARVLYTRTMQHALCVSGAIMRNLRCCMVSHCFQGSPRSFQTLMDSQPDGVPKAPSSQLFPASCIPRWGGTSGGASPPCSRCRGSPRTTLRGLMCEHPTGSDIETLGAGHVAIAFQGRVHFDSSVKCCFRLGTTALTAVEQARRWHEQIAASAGLLPFWAIRELLFRDLMLGDKKVRHRLISQQRNRVP